MWSLLLAGCPAPTGLVPDDPGVPADACVDRDGEAFCDGAVAVTCSAGGEVAATEACDPSAAVCTDGACVSCGIAATVRYADPAAPRIVVEVDDGPAGVERLPRTRPVDVAGAGTVAVTGPFELLRADGSPVGDEVRDEPILVRATAEGTGVLTIASLAPCGAAPVELALVAIAPVPFAGTILDGFPWFDTAHELVNDGDDLDLEVDAAAYADRVGLPYDAVLVRHRTPAEWAADPTFGDAADDAVPGVVGDPATTAWTVSGGPDLLEPYDVVLDFGRDGRLDPGDLVDGFDAPALLVADDLSEPGPYTPIQGEISASYWLTAVVYGPEESDQLDPMPLVVVSHGNGHDYTWYDWLGQHLASWGYVVLVHRNDTAPGPLSAADTTWQNTEWFLSELATLADGAFDGEVDPDRIAWIGHSRGGEGVVIAYHQLVGGQIAPSAYAAEDVVLVSSIAPTVFEGPDTRNPHGVSYHLLAGSADGDVTGGIDNEVTQYFRLFQRATGTRTVTYLQGADHNDFNCCGLEDSLLVPAGDRGPLIGRERAQQAAKSWYLALLEATFHGEDALWEYHTRLPELFRPPGAEVVATTSLRRGDGDRKVVIDDFQSNSDPGVSSSGGVVSGTVRALTEGALDDGNSLLAANAGDAMNGMSQAHGDPDPERGIVFEWDDGDDLVLDFEVPAAERDLSDDAFVSLRACQATRDPHTLELLDLLSFTVALVDEQGAESAVDHAVYGRIPSPYPRGGLGSGTGWVNEFQTVRIPIAAFAARGAPIDLARVATIRLRFGAAHGSPTGRIGLDDVEVLEGGSP